MKSSPPRSSLSSEAGPVEGKKRLLCGPRVALATAPLASGWPGEPGEAWLFVACTECHFLCAQHSARVRLTPGLAGADVQSVYLCGTSVPSARAGATGAVKDADHCPARR